MTNKIVFFLCFLSLFFSAQAQVKWPAVTSTTKPWTRWWWEGSAVNKQDLTWNLEQYQKAGLGGVEITPIYGVHGYEKQFIHFLSPKWLDVFKHTLNESKRLGLGVDLANATGWPFGGPWTTEADASKSVYVKTYSLTGGEGLKEPVQYKSAVDIPETEGVSVLRFKFATSAANVSGKPLVAAESATWLNEHFLSSWVDVKKAVDLYFLGDVNHIVYHGTAYSPKAAPWPGWLFYAAVHFQPTNPQWSHFSTLNGYITRAQSFLQASKPDNDVLLYYPLPDKYSEPGRDLLQHFDGMEHNFENSDFEHVSERLIENGYGFDFFSDRQLQTFTQVGRGIQTGGNTYQTILLPANKLITTESFQKLVTLAKGGASVLVYKDMPTDVPGWHDLASRRKTFQTLLTQLRFTENGKVKKATVGKGAFWVSDDLAALLNVASSRQERLAEKGLSFIRRRNNEGAVYFLNNRTDKVVDGWLPLATKPAKKGSIIGMQNRRDRLLTSPATGLLTLWKEDQPYRKKLPSKSWVHGRILMAMR